MSGRDSQRDDPYQDTIGVRPRRTMMQHPAVLLTLVAIILGLLYMAYRSSADGSSLAAEDQATIQSDTGSADDGGDASSDESQGEEAALVVTDGDDAAAADETAESGASNPSGGAAPIPDPNGPFVAARLNLDASPGAGLFVLSGRVPDQQIADQVRQAAELSYGPFVQSELEVDTSLPPAEWLAAAPQVIGLLPSVTDGTIMVADGKVLLSARSPNPLYLQTLQGALGLLSGGMAVETVDTVITDLEPPLFNVAAENGTVTLSGYVPSEQVVGLLAGAAAASYGEVNVVNELTIDAGTYPSFWMQIMPGALQLMRAYPGYNFTVENGQFSGTIQGGGVFAADSTEITEATAQALNIGVSILARDISIGMTITGHTDSQGADEYNKALSLARAQTVVDYFVAGGIDPSRLVAEGAGESQPIADNETVEGRAANRRVEFQFGPVLTGQ